MSNIQNPRPAPPAPSTAAPSPTETLAYGARPTSAPPQEATAQTLLMPSEAGASSAPTPPTPGAPMTTNAWDARATILAESTADTLAASTPRQNASRPEPARRGAPGETTGPGRTASPQVTVLPRVTLQGDRPAFITDLRQRYEIVGPLGEGGIGEVLSAKDHDIDRRVALKRIRTQVESPEALARFVEEIRTTGGLEHPNIVPIHDVGLDEEGRYYFIMKYVDGETLESILARLRAGDRETHARYGFERRVEIFKGVLEAIAYAHAQGYVHRDLKPANIMVGAFGEVLVMDWGIARTVGRGSASLDRAFTPDAGADVASGHSRLDRPFATQVGSLIGTPAYMAPEQARGEPADVRSDIYALGVLLHEFLTLRHYLADRTTVADTLQGVLEKPLPHASFLRHPHQSAVPADLGWFVSGAVAKEPQDRYPSVDAMIERLDRRAAGEIPVQCPMTALKASTHWALRLLDRRPLLVLGLVTLSTLVLLGAAGYAVSRLF